MSSLLFQHCETAINCCDINDSYLCWNRLVTNTNECAGGITSVDRSAAIQAKLLARKGLCDAFDHQVSDNRGYKTQSP